MTEFIVGIVFGIVLSYFLVGYLVRSALSQAHIDLESLVEALEESTKNIIQARVEQHDGVFYVYDCQTNTFLVQGSSVGELRDKLDKQFQDKKIFVTEGDQAVIEALRATGGQ